MATWLEHVADPRSIHVIYGESLPTLHGVEVHELVLNRDGPRVELLLDLADYPEHPPAKWTAAGYSKVHVHLMLVGILKVSVRGWATTVQLDLDLKPHGDALRLLAAPGDPVELDVVAQAVMIAHVTAYAV